MKILSSRILAELITTGSITHRPKQNAGNCEFGLNQKLTKFDIRAIAYKQRSKKARSDEIRVREGGQLAYRYVGKVIKFRRSHNSLNNSILFRNVVDLASFELIMPIFSPLVTYTNFSQTKHKRTNAYYLRNTAPVKSKVEFNYVIEE
jgi:ribosomal protein L19